MQRPTEAGTYLSSDVTSDLFYQSAITERSMRAVGAWGLERHSEGDKHGYFVTEHLMRGAGCSKSAGPTYHNQAREIKKSCYRGFDTWFHQLRWPQGGKKI